jgi:hypothetical protein
MKWSFYDARGEVSSRVISAPTREIAEANAPPGFTAILGPIDRDRYQINPETEEVVDRTEARALSQGEQEIKARRVIAELERRQQRPLRDLTLDPNNPQARAKLRAIEDQIAEHRKALKRI